MVGVVLLIVLLIESIASTTFNQGAGAMCMIILGCMISNFKNISLRPIAFIACKLIVCIGHKA